MPKGRWSHTNSSSSTRRRGRCPASTQWPLRWRRGTVKGEREGVGSGRRCGLQRRSVCSGRLDPFDHTRWEGQCLSASPRAPTTAGLPLSPPTGQLNALHGTAITSVRLNREGQRWRCIGGHGLRRWNAAPQSQRGTAQPHDRQLDRGSGGRERIGRHRGKRNEEAMGSGGVRRGGGRGRLREGDVGRKG